MDRYQILKEEPYRSPVPHSETEKVEVINKRLTDLCKAYKILVNGGPGSIEFNIDFNKGFVPDSGIKEQPAGL
jgi:hypothetical protein